MRLPGQRACGAPVDVVWDAARGWTAASLRQRVADFYSLPVDNIEVAKYFPEKSEWLPVSSWVKPWGCRHGGGGQAHCHLSQIGS